MSNFGSYIIPTIIPTSTPPPDFPQGSSKIINGWQRISKKHFSDPSGAGFVKYKGHHNAIKIEATIILSFAVFTSPVALTLSVMKNGSQKTFIAGVSNFTSGGVPTTLTTLTGAIILDNIHHGDRFAIVLTNNNSDVPLDPLVLSGSWRMSSV